MAQIYALWQPDGSSGGFWRDDIHSLSQIPSAAVPIDEATWLAYLAGGWRWDGSKLVAYAPPATTVIPTVTGNQWAFALSDMGLAAAWRVGKTKSKDSDQTRLELIARDTPLVVSDPLLIRVAANAGTDANGSPLVSVPAVFLHAQGMPT